MDRESTAQRIYGKSYDQLTVAQQIAVDKEVDQAAESQQLREVYNPEDGQYHLAIVDTNTGQVISWGAVSDRPQQGSAGPTGGAYSQADIQALANQPGVKTVTPQGYDFLVTYDDGSTQRYYRNASGGYNSSAPSKAASESTASGKVTLSKGSVPQVQERYQNTKLGGATTGGGTTATTPFTSVDDAVNAVLQRYSVGQGPIGVSAGAQSAGSGDVASGLAYGNYGTNAPIINAFGGNVPAGREDAELSAIYLHNLQNQMIDEQGMTPTQSAAAIELSMQTPINRYPAGYDPSNPTGTQSDPITGRLIEGPAQKSTDQAAKDYQANLARIAAGYAKGGSLRLQEPAALIGLQTGKPLAMMGEGGMQETLSDGGRGRIMVSPTKDQITMGREQMGSRIGSVRKPGFQGDVMNTRGGGRSPFMGSMSDRIGTAPPAMRKQMPSLYEMSGRVGTRPLGVKAFAIGGQIDYRQGTSFSTGSSTYGTAPAWQSEIEAAPEPALPGAPELREGGYTSPRPAAVAPAPYSLTPGATTGLDARTSELAAERTLFEQNQPERAAAATSANEFGMQNEAERRAALEQEQAFYQPIQAGREADLARLKNYDTTLDYRYGIAGLESGYSKLNRETSFRESERELETARFLRSMGYDEDARRLEEQAKNRQTSFEETERRLEEQQLEQTNAFNEASRRLDEQRYNLTNQPGGSTDLQMQSLLQEYARLSAGAGDKVSFGSTRTRMREIQAEIDNLNRARQVGLAV